MKKLVSIILAASMAVSAAALLSGCGDDNYPVQVANYTISKEPGSVVVLDADAADIMAYMDYDKKIKGRSEAVTQDELKSVPVVGPDISRLAELEPDLIFASNDLDSEYVNKLEDKDIKVIRLQAPQSASEIKTNYRTIGKIFGGKANGGKRGEEYCDKFFDELEKQKEKAEEKSGAGVKTMCYLYLNGDKLAMLINDSAGLNVLDYTNCMDIPVTNPAANDLTATIAGANPTCIFYDTDATLQAIKADQHLSKINAVKNNRLMQIPAENLSRPGITAVRTLTAMNDFIYSNSTATPDKNTTQPSTQASTDPSASQPTSQPASTPATSQPSTQPSTGAQTQETTVPATTQPEPQDVSSKYDIDLDGLVLEKEDSSDDVKAMQKRLADLGYVKNNEDYVTGYYGPATEKAVKAFQKNSGIKETGKADNKTLVEMFRSTAKRA